MTLFLLPVLVIIFLLSSYPENVSEKASISVRGLRMHGDNELATSTDIESESDKPPPNCIICLDNKEYCRDLAGNIQCSWCKQRKKCSEEDCVSKNRRCCGCGYGKSCSRKLSVSNANIDKTFLDTELDANQIQKDEEEDQRRCAYQRYCCILLDMFLNNTVNAAINISNHHDDSF